LFSDFSVREKLGQLVIASLKFGHEAIDYATVEMLCSLMQPMHPNYELKVEQLNKQSLLSSKAFVEHLLQLVVTHVVGYFCGFFIQLYRRGEPDVW